MEIVIAAVGILVTGLVVMGMILATPAGTESASRATGEAPEPEPDERPSGPGTADAASRGA